MGNNPAKPIPKFEGLARTYEDIIDFAPKPFLNTDSMEVQNKLVQKSVRRSNYQYSSYQKTAANNITALSKSAEVSKLSLLLLILYGLIMHIYEFWSYEL